MRSSRKSIVAIAAVAALLALTLTACGGETPGEEPTTPAATATAQTETPASAPDGAALLQDRCTECHSADRIAARSESAAEWEAIVDQMIARGAQLDDQEKQALVDYLATTYPD